MVHSFIFCTPKAKKLTDESTRLRGELQRLHTQSKSSCNSSPSASGITSSPCSLTTSGSPSASPGPGTPETAWQARPVGCFITTSQAGRTCSSGSVVPALSPTVVASVATSATASSVSSSSIATIAASSHNTTNLISSISVASTSPVGGLGRSPRAGVNSAAAAATSVNSAIQPSTPLTSGALAPRRTSLLLSSSSSAGVVASVLKAGSSSASGATGAAYHMPAYAFHQHRHTSPGGPNVSVLSTGPTVRSLIQSIENQVNKFVLLSFVCLPFVYSFPLLIDARK
ncbi:unnamed protein product [Protopolystoma xenopodis]|uniref:Uncharacterized protein n=1 Tax=Protopolystoma xenopodis TaxID=117903 RepID=A0A448WFT5_9PLAT|nr:unnamed protein product [Protopolystoma xenopodis]